MFEMTGLLMSKISDDDLKMLIAKNLLAARMMAGLTQSDAMAELYQCEKAYFKAANRMSELEKGPRVLDVIGLVRLCKLYGVSADYILGFTDEPELNEASRLMGHIHTAMTEVAAASIEQYAKNLTATCSKYLSKLPSPKHLVVIDVAMNVLKLMKEGYNDLSSPLQMATSDLDSAILDYERKQRVKNRNFELAVLEIQEKDVTARHVLQADVIKKKCSKKSNPQQCKLFELAGSI